MFVPSLTYRIFLDDSWFDSAEKQKLCTHEFSFVKSQKRDFALILFATDQQTNFPVRPILVEFLEFQKFALVTDCYRLFCFYSVFRVLFAYFNASMASNSVYEP